MVDLETVLKAAGRAPSGDNTQPWRFLVDSETGRVGVQVDETRDPSPMNAGQRMARIAVGAALENLGRSAESLGWRVEPDTPHAGELTAIRLTRSGEPKSVDDTIRRRVTNRKVYDARPIPEPDLARLREQTPDDRGVRTLWLTDRAQVRELGHLIGASDALMFGDPSMRRAFLANVRFDVKRQIEVEEGLSFDSLEASAPDRAALRTMRLLPDWSLRIAGIGRVFAKKAQGLVESASGLCLVSAPDRLESTDLRVGRAMERAWLALTEFGLSAQPMMSLMILDNVQSPESQGMTSAAFRQRAAELTARIPALVPELAGGRPAFLLRFGRSAQPTGRTGRRPVSAFSTWEGAGATQGNRTGEDA